jgi:hypothetical protein
MERGEAWRPGWCVTVQRLNQPREFICMDPSIGSWWKMASADADVVQGFWQL